MPLARLFSLFSGLLCLLVLGLWQFVEAADEIDFDTQIRPLLEQRCYECHGPDKGESGLRLHLKDAALSGGDSGAAIVPGEPENSLLIKYVSGDDPELTMPPDGENLSAAEIELLTRWIAAGAAWPDDDASRQRSTHWAYQPLVRHPAPTVQQPAWVASPIDAFVLSRLEAAQLAPALPADRNTLIKRLYYDLLGLPPTPAAVQHFISNSSPQAYAELVDELLQSPHFGERWGRHWLDKARYADSDGYEKDRPRPHAWKYRDWVIQAINDDLPFDQFTIEQLAGDLLPEATPNQLQATAFNRQTLTNTEGGADQEEFRVEAVFDRVETLGTVWLGLTVGCARCHSHKYDDISQREYYQLFAFFNNADEQDRMFPSSSAAEQTYLAAKKVHDQQLAELTQPLQAAREQLRPEFAAWEGQQRTLLAELNAHPLREIAGISSQPESVAGVTFTQLEADKSWLVSGEVGPTDVYTMRWQPRVAGTPVTSLLLELLPDESLPGRGPGRAENGNFVLSELTLDLLLVDGSTQRIPLSAATADFSQGGFDPLQAIDGDERNMGWAIAPQMGKPHHARFLLKEPLDMQEAQSLSVRLVQQYEREGLTPHALGRFRVSSWTGTDPSLPSVPKDIVDILSVPAADRKPAQSETLFAYFTSLNPAVKALQAAVDLHNKNAPFNPAMPVATLVERTQKRRTTRILKRGEFLNPLGEVQPGTLQVLPALDAAPQHRLDLARWVVAAENPLTPRVTVNEIWSHLFGQGLVTTLNDFGVRGAAPSHPELLDWLATEFLRIGWSRKQLIRTIVLSNTYQQSAVQRVELLELDPQNRLLARQNRFRVEAEIVRDLYLAAAGLLEPRIGGPSVFPNLPPGIAELSYANNFKWGESDWNSRPDRPHTTPPNADMYRRGLYTFFKRTAAHPNLTTFDCPDSNTTCVARQLSNTPLQALQTLNNSTFVEASQALGRTIVSQPGDDSDRLQALFQQCVARTPNSDEQAALTYLLTTARSYYQQHPDEARTFAGIKDQPEPAEPAAWTLLARTVLNLDEFVTRE